jgi:hypothetical protein
VEVLDAETVCALAQRRMDQLRGAASPDGTGASMEDGTGASMGDEEEENMQENIAPNTAPSTASSAPSSAPAKPAPGPAPGLLIGCDPLSLFVGPEAVAATLVRVDLPESALGGRPGAPDWSANTLDLIEGRASAEATSQLTRAHGGLLRCGVMRNAWPRLSPVLRAALLRGWAERRERDARWKGSTWVPRLPADGEVFRDVDVEALAPLYAGTMVGSRADMLRAVHDANVREGAYADSEEESKWAQVAREADRDFSEEPDIPVGENKYYSFIGGDGVHLFAINEEKDGPDHGWSNFLWRTFMENKN